MTAAGARLALTTVVVVLYNGHAARRDVRLRVAPRPGRALRPGLRRRRRRDLAADGRPDRARAAARPVGRARARAARPAFVAWLLAADRLHHGRLRHPRPARVLHLLRAHPGARLLPHRRVGRARAQPRRAEVLRLHLRRVGLPLRRHAVPGVPAPAPGRRRAHLRRRRPARDGDEPLDRGAGSSLAFAVAFGVKSPIFPLHTWSPLAYAEAPTAGSIELSALLAKLGTYGLLRFAVGLLPLALGSVRPWLLDPRGHLDPLRRRRMACVTPDLKRLVAYSSLAQMGFITLGVVSGQQDRGRRRGAADVQPRGDHRRALPAGRLRRARAAAPRRSPRSPACRGPRRCWPGSSPW